MEEAGKGEGKGHLKDKAVLGEEVSHLSHSEEDLAEERQGDRELST